MDANITPIQGFLQQAMMPLIGNSVSETIPPMNSREIISANINRLMKAHGITDHKRLAALAMVGHSTVHRMRNEEVSSSVDILAKIAAVFGLQAWQMLVPDMDPNNKPELAEPTGVGYQRVTTIYKALDDDGRAFLDNSATAAWAVYQQRMKERAEGKDVERMEEDE